MSSLSLRVLGPPEVRHGEQTLTFPTRKALALLIYLVVEGGMHTRRRLSELLWPDVDAEHGRAALRSTLQQLRVALNEEDPLEELHIRIDRETLTIDASATIFLDMQRLHAVHRQVQTAMRSDRKDRIDTLKGELYEVVQLTRGDFLTGFALRGAAPFEEWVRYQRDLAHRHLQDVYACLSTSLLKSGELDQALDVTTRWLAFDPLDEQGYQHLMRLHVARGDRAAALRAYQACRDILSTELQIEPSPDTLALVAQIRTSVPPAKREPPSGSNGATHTHVSLEVPLVGRATQFRSLIRCYQQAVQGQPHMALLEGEAGIGKTRLASDLLAWARSQGAVTLQGRAYEMEKALPYQPLILAVRPLLQRNRDLHKRLADVWLAECSRLFPELRERYPHLSPPATQDEHAQSRLFEAITHLLHALVPSQPLVLFLDDLQWADTATLDLLHYVLLSWTQQAQPALLLCSRRASGESLSSFTSWEQQVQRTCELTRLSLGLVTQQDIQYLLETLQHRGAAAPAKEQRQVSQSTTEQATRHLSQWLYQETQGHPFYLLETLKTLLDRQVIAMQIARDGQAHLDVRNVLENKQALHRVLPHSVLELIRHRLYRLSQQAQLFLLAGAILGTPLRFDQVCQVAGIGEEEGLLALDEAVKATLLREETQQGPEQESCYQFTHDLLREVVYSQATSARRRVFHRRALELLQATETPAAELARHALACGQGEAAFRYLIAAGDEAMAVFAVQDAIAQYEQARVLLDAQARQLRGEDAQLLHLYLHVGRAYEILEQWDQAQQTYEAMLSFARTTQRTLMSCMALNHLAFIAINQSMDIDRAVLLLQDAQALASESHDSRMEAEVAWNLAQAFLHSWQLQVAQQHALHALTLARSLDDPELVARSLYVLATPYLWQGKHEEAITATTEAIALYTQLETQATSSPLLPMYMMFSGAAPSFQLTNKAALIGCLILRIVAHLCLGHVAAGLQDARRAVMLSQATKNRVLHAWSLQNLNHMLLETGEYEEALAITLQAAQLIETSSNVIIRYYILAVLGYAYQSLFLLEQAQTTLEQAIALVKTLPTRVEEEQLLVLPWLCVNQGLAGQWHAAAATAQEVLRLRRHSEAALIMKGFTAPYETRALLHVGKRAEAAAAVERLGESIGTNQRYRISYLRARAVLAYDGGDTGQAISLLREAAQLADTLSLPAEQWQIHAMLGNLLQEQGEDERATAAYAHSAAIIHALAARLKDEALRSHFLQSDPIRRVLERDRLLLAR